MSQRDGAVLTLSLQPITAMGPETTARRLGHHGAATGRDCCRNEICADALLKLPAADRNGWTDEAA